MSTEADFTRFHDCSIGYQLARFEYDSTLESRASFLGRLAYAAESRGEETIVPHDTAYFQNIIPAWRLAFPTLRNSRYGYAKRELPEEVRPAYEKYSAPGRLVSLKDSHVVMLVYSAFHGSDIAAMLRLEQEITSGGSPAEPDWSKTLVDIEKYHENGQPAETSLDLSQGQLDVLWLLASSRDEVAQKLHIAPSTVENRLYRASHKNGMGLNQLIKTAVAEGLVNLGALSIEDYGPLTDIELKVLENILDTAEETGKILRRSESTAANLRMELYAKMKVNSKMQAFLAGVRDGLINP